MLGSPSRKACEELLYQDVLGLSETEIAEGIEEEKESAMRDMRREVALISMSIAEQIIRKELVSDKGQQELVDKLVDEVSSLSRTTSTMA